MFLFSCAFYDGKISLADVVLHHLNQVKLFERQHKQHTDVGVRLVFIDRMLHHHLLRLRPSSSPSPLLRPFPQFYFVSESADRPSQRNGVRPIRTWIIPSDVRLITYLLRF